MRRVAVTGVGIVSALGVTRESTWQHMLDGACGVRPVTLFDVTGYRSQVAAEVPMAGVAAHETPLERRRRSRADRMGLMAADEALADAGLLDGVFDRRRAGVMLGAGTADLLRNETYFFTTLDAGIERARPSQAWNHFASTPGDVIARKHGFEGQRACVAAACSSSTIAIGQAMDAIRLGRLDAVVAGGTDALARLTYSGFNALRLMDPGPCRPFERRRAGMNMGEGAGMLVLEDMEHARRRGAHIYAELGGYSLGCEAFHPTAPQPDGRPVADVVRRALADAGVDAADVDHINAHGTATPQNDQAEARAYRTVFGERVRRLPLTSLKSMIGHCLGAAGALEAAVVVLTVARGLIPPTINHAETDPECAVDVVANVARETPVRCAVSTSLAFGGNDSALVIRSV
ncbi:MAG TPA: beta-ketoacyl-[acyl-carrier-protein] synthase family protein [Vicinamibacterales bacterium]|nr:beta-ketoacyl-[acyl-carrier-protein] synthase family protein [Vicinamibacterales bacterium]